SGSTREIRRSSGIRSSASARENTTGALATRRQGPPAPVHDAPRRFYGPRRTRGATSSCSVCLASEVTEHRAAASVESRGACKTAWTRPWLEPQDSEGDVLPDACALGNDRRRRGRGARSGEEHVAQDRTPSAPDTRNGERSPARF